MNFQQLHYFEKIALYKSINKAAKELYLAPSALLSSLNTLEKELDCQLFFRGKKGLSLTPAGHIFLGDVQTILSISKGWEKLTDRLILPDQVDIPIAVVRSVFHSVFPDIVLKIKELAPNINLCPMESRSPELEQALFEQKVTCAIQSRLLEENESFDTIMKNLGLDYEWVYDEKFFVFVGQGNPLFFEDYVVQSQLENLIGISQPYKTALKYPYMDFYQIEKTIFLENIPHILHKLSVSPEHFSILPAILRKNIYCTSGKVRGLPIKGASLLQRYALIYSKIGYITEEELFVIKLIRDHLKAVQQEFQT